MDTRFFQTIKELPLILSSEHFILRYGLRNPRQGRGLGPDGVGDSVLVRSYRNSLERLYQTMRRPPWNRRPPKVGAYGKTLVYVCDIPSPFTSYFPGQGLPFIGLPCRSSEPMNDSAMRRAAAEAVHEAVHVFNFTKRPLDSPWAPWWEWFDEALAVYLESRVLPGNHDYFRFLNNWVDLPGIPLNDWDAAYQACLFIHYLSARLGPGFPNEVWIKSKSNEKPLEALKRLLKARGLVFADPNQRDLFASGYAMDCYFLRDHKSRCFAPELCNRYGDRAVVASYGISRGETLEFEGELPHLACNYFRIYPHRGVDRVRFVLHPGAGAKTGLKAEVAIAYPDFHRSRATVLRPQKKHADASGRRTAKIDNLPGHDLNHIVLVVTNCRLEEVSRTFPSNYLGEGFRVEVSAD